MNMEYIIFGAKSVALGVYRAIKHLYKEIKVGGFLVSSRADNPDMLEGLPVYELGEFGDKEACILVATPEASHEEIVKSLEKCGFHNYICIDSHKESVLMERYYESIGKFPSLHSKDLFRVNCENAGEMTGMSLQVYMAKSHKDKPLKNPCILHEWVIPLQVGAILTPERIAGVTDADGDNISTKNVNYCELTALYWLWKNCLGKTWQEGISVKPTANMNITTGTESDYYGLFHYRRLLDIWADDLRRIVENDIDAVLPFPTVHTPDIREHHARYIKESDWEAMLQALKELHPEYYEAYESIFAQQYLYNYNILVAKRSVLARYCAWLFPILERTEELSRPKGSERADRYIGYIGENLLTLYFMYHSSELKIAHTGMVMLV